MSEKVDNWAKNLSDAVSPDKRPNLQLRLKIMELLDTEEEGYAFYYSYFEQETGYNRAEIKAEMDELRRLGYVIHAKGLFSEETGMTAGSGFSKAHFDLSFDEYLKYLKEILPNEKR